MTILLTNCKSAKNRRHVSNFFEDPSVQAYTFRMKWNKRIHWSWSRLKWEYKVWCKCKNYHVPESTISFLRSEGAFLWSKETKEIQSCLDRQGMSPKQKHWIPVRLLVLVASAHSVFFFYAIPLFRSSIKSSRWKRSCTAHFNPQQLVSRNQTCSRVFKNAQDFVAITSNIKCFVWFLTQAKNQGGSSDRWEAGLLLRVLTCSRRTGVSFVCHSETRFESCVSLLRSGGMRELV